MDDGPEPTYEEKTKNESTPPHTPWDLHPIHYLLFGFVYLTLQNLINNNILFSFISTHKKLLLIG